MSKVKDLQDIILSKEENEKLLSFENELFNDEKESNIFRKHLDNEDMYNGKIEYDQYINELEENAEIFTEEELNKLKTEEAFEEYLKLPEDQKRELFPLSLDDEFDKEIMRDEYEAINDLLMPEEEDTRIDFN